MPHTRSQLNRLPLMLPAALALLGALWGGLLRLGWSWPILHAPLPLQHGPLMIGGVLGTVVCLERAVALGRRWAYLAPLATGLGALLALAGAPVWAGAAAITLGSLLLIAIFAAIVRRQPALYTALFVCAALVWALGNLLWLAGAAIPSIVMLWLAFLVLTIVAERLELSRLLRPTRRQYALFLAGCGLVAGGALLAPLKLAPGTRIVGSGLLGLALWLARYDLARRTVRKQGLTRFVAVALLSGYLWLGVGGVLALIYGGIAGGPAYDALLHAVFVGFVISMLFGHAPIVFPAVLGLRQAYDRSCYAPLALLHASLALRLAGDLAGLYGLRKAGGLLNAVALLLFIANTLRIALAAHRKQSTAPTAASALPLAERQAS